MRVAKFLAIALFVLPMLIGSPVSADETPASWVGRVSRVEGNLAIRAPPAPSSTQASATQPSEWCDSVDVNDPVAAGMSVRTGPQSRTVLRSGSESIVMSSATELDLAQLDASGAQIVLRRGRIGVRLSQLDPAHSIEIDIPRGGVWLLTPGEYDITAGDAKTPARIATLDGRARFVGKGTDKIVATGSAVLLNGTDPLAASLGSATPDALIAWWRSADPAGSNEKGTQALRYVSPEITGYAALDANGSWQTIADYGAVWFPKSVPADWAPYRDGHWRWVAPWGWTWIDDLEWGFATSHYGRWARIGTPQPGNERWGWVPGRQAAHPAYAPAVVAFLGTAGVGLSYPDAFGPAVAWFPLAPGEIYWPAYTSDIAAIRRLNPDASDLAAGEDGTPPASVITATYHNRRFASVVPRPVFLGGRPVAPSIVQLPEQRLDDAPLLAGSPQLMPTARAPAGTAIASAAPKIAAATHKVARTLERHHAQPTPRRTIMSARERKRLKFATARARAWAAHLPRPHPIAAPPPRPPHLATTTSRHLASR